MIIKVLLISATLVFGVLILRERPTAGRQAVRRLALLGLVLLGIIAVAFPDTTSWAAELVGVKRGTDLVLYIFVMAFLFTTVALYQRIHLLEQRIIELTRTLALRDAGE